MLSVLEFSVLLAAVTVTGLVMTLWFIPHRDSVSVESNDHDDGFAFLFEDGVLHHATRKAAALLPACDDDQYWQDLRDTLIARFPDFPVEAGQGQEGHIALNARDHTEPQGAVIHWRDDLCWVTLTNDPQNDLATTVTPPPTELDALRKMSTTAPHPVWQEDMPGEVIWYNTAYAELFEATHGHPVTVHEPLFCSEKSDAKDRVYVDNAEGTERNWFRLDAITQDHTTVFHATNINALVAAEHTQRNFVQTLAKTFAHLSIGLAIFDRNGQLVLFNPALVDLTKLSAQFLSGRPDMLSFFDQLRENRKMPEPKNYHNWREELSDLISAAADGSYQETWTLESGQTYQVQGRPHPEGATAFLIEDISAEMTLTRNFRAELEQAQTMIDAANDAMAIFSPAGFLTFSNTAFHTLWKVDPGTAFADVNLQDCEKIWKEGSHAAVDTASINQLVSAVAAQDHCQVELMLKGGVPFGCKVAPIPAGGTLVQFYKRALSPANRPLERSG